MEVEWKNVPAAIWRRYRQGLRPVEAPDPIRWEDLHGIDTQKEKLAHNTERFLAGKPANHALLWGSRGTGKSSLVKALLNRYRHQGLRVIEVDKEDLVHLPEIVDGIRQRPERFIIYCDDLSFGDGDPAYKPLKSVLEGSIELPPENVRVYATSNRRHLMPEYFSDNRNTTMEDGEIHPSEAVEEQISLSDRFGLWLSFYPFREAVYLEAVDALFPDVQDREALHREALQFALARGGRSGRTAQQFYRMRSGEIR
jgi:hypothetical protein